MSYPRESMDSREGFEPDQSDLDEMCAYWESLEMDESYEDDGQPDEHQEWDDLYGYGPEWD